MDAFVNIKTHLSSATLARQARTAATSRPLLQYPHVIVITLMHVCTFLLLFTLRGADDNRLTSWQWVFTQQQLYILALLLSGVLLLFCWHRELNIFRRHNALLLFIVAFGTGMSLWHEPEVIVDTARYFSQAKYLSEYGPVYFLQQWGHEIGAWTDLPLVPFIYGLMLKFFGESRLVIQVTTTLMFAGTVVLTYYIGRTLWDDMLGLYGGALLLAMPFMLTQIPLMLVDVPSMFFLTLAIYVSLQAVNKGSIMWFVFAAIAIAMAVLAKYSTWLMLSVLPVMIFISDRGTWTQAGRRLLIILCGAGLLLTPLLVWKLDVISAQLQLLASYQLPGLQRWQESPLSTFFYQVHPFVSISAIASTYLAIRQRDRRYLLVAWMLLLIIMLDINRSRYALIAFPMLALMAAYAIRQIANVSLRHYLVLSIIAASLVITLGGYRPFLQNNSASNLQYAGAYLDDLNVGAVEVIVLPQQRSTINPLVSVPLLDLFTRQKVLFGHTPNLISPPARQLLSTSPLRFSWEYKLPRYYTDDALITNRAIAVIASDVDQVLPAAIRKRLLGYQQSVQFAQQDGVFRYSTIVTIYEFSLKRG